MQSARKDEWLQFMVEAQAKLANDAVAETVRLREQVRQLEAQLAGTPGYIWELQERVALLEIHLAQSKGKS